MTDEQLRAALVARLANWATEMDRSADAMAASGLGDVAAGNRQLCSDLRLAVKGLCQPPTRAKRQARTWTWVLAAFGTDQPLAQRGVRLAEEAIELAQAAGTPRDMLHRLVDFVYDRPPGEIGSEIGGVGITLLAIAACAGLDADAEEQRELERVLAKPLEHFSARNEAKNAAGFDARGKG